MLALGLLACAVGGGGGGTTPSPPPITSSTPVPTNGVTTPTVPPCVTTLAGSATIESQDDVDALAGICIVTGDVAIAAPGLAAMALPDLLAIDGSLTITGNDDLEVSIPALAAVARIWITANTGPVTLDAPALPTVPQLRVADTAVTVVALSSLSSAGELVFDRADTLTLEVPSLTDVDRVALDIDTHLTAWPWDALERAGDLSLAFADTAPAVAFPALANVTGALSLETGFAIGCDPTRVDLPVLATAGDLTLGACRLEAHLPALETITGNLLVPYATDVDALDLPLLREVHSLAIDLPWERGLEMYDLPSLEVVHGSLGIFGGISAPSLTAIEGDVVPLDTFSYELSSVALFLRTCDQTEISLPALVAIDGYTQILDDAAPSCPGVAPVVVDLSSLVAIDGGATLSFFGAADVDLAALATADTLTLGGGTTWNLPSLAAVTDRITVGDVALPALATANDLTVVGDADLPALTTVTGKLFVQYGSPMVRYPSLLSASELQIWSDDTISVDLPSLTSVGPSASVSPYGFTVSGAAQLISVSAPSLAIVDGPLTLSLNPSWCQSDVDLLRTGIPTITGAVTTTGNNDGC